jgi:hypothetical protein
VPNGSTIAAATRTAFHQYRALRFAMSFLPTPPQSNDDAAPLVRCAR